MKLNTALLLGAGFSYPAGIPMMNELAKGFPESLTDQERKIYLRIRELIPEMDQDFELLMECFHDWKEIPIYLLDRLTQRDFGEYFTDLKQLVKGAIQLEERLQEYLRKSCTMEKKRRKYLYPMMTWLKKKECRLDIFTLNYDLLIEELCDEFFLRYTDGFLFHWQPDLFQDQQFQICLYKLHGSFTWYQSKMGERFKIPLVSQRSEMEDFAEDQVASMMVYPRRKKYELFSDLLRMFRERLLTLDQLVVIGYSFRDEELIEIVQDGLRKNQQLRLEIVVPNAEGMTLFGDDQRVTYFSGGVEEWVAERKYLDMT